MDLVKAIDALLVYVDNHWKTPDYGQRLDNEFNPLDTDVYVKARELGLHDSDMPRKDATFHDDGVVFFGRTNVPGAWKIRPNEAVTLVLMATQGWLADMQTLRSIALSSTLNQTTSQEPLPGVTEDKAGARQNEVLASLLNEDALQVAQILQSGDSADSKMRKICGLDRTYLGKSATEWGKLLNVSRSAVSQTRFWKEDLKKAQEAQRDMRD